MPRYNLLLAQGDGEREHITHDSSDRELEVGDQVDIAGRCWELVERAPEADDTFVCGPCRPYAIFLFDGHTGPILQRDIPELDRGLRNLHLQQPESVRQIRDALAAARPDVPGINLTEEKVSELYQTLFAMQVEGPLSSDLDNLRIECYRYLDDRGHFNQAS